MYTKTETLAVNHRPRTRCLTLMYNREKTSSLTIYHFTGRTDSNSKYLFSKILNIEHAAFIFINDKQENGSFFLEEI